MVWVKLDDRFYDNRKVRRAWLADPASVGLYVMATTYCAAHDLDGSVDVAFVEEKLPDAQKRQVATDVLVTVGLWEQDADRGWLIHDYLAYNPSREEVLERRAERAESGRRGGLRSGQVRRSEATAEATAEANTKLDRSKPEANTNPVPEPVPQQQQIEADKLPLVDLDQIDPLADQVNQVFTEWIKATERDPHRTRLIGERKRIITKALTSHGLDDCLAAVRHIGADAWARGANDRGTRFDDIKHALGSAERIERWRDWTPPNGQGRGVIPAVAEGSALIRAAIEKLELREN